MMDFRRVDIAKQKAYDLLRDWIKLVARHTNPDQDISELLGWLWKLRPATPDPITGLVPCGCGYNPELRAVDRGWYQVYCTGCDMHGGYSHTPNNVIEEWNTAMGWKGGAE